MRTPTSRTYVTETGYQTVFSGPIGGGNATGCYVTSNDTGACSFTTGTDNPLQYGDDGHAQRIYVKFPDINNVSSPVPTDAIVTDAQLTFTESSSTNATKLDTRVTRLGADWNSTMRWGTQPAVAGTLKDQVMITPPGAGNTVSYDIPEMARGWLKGEKNGGYANYGVMIKIATESNSNMLRFYGFANPKRPQLSVDWSYAVGQQPFVPAYDHRLSDRTDIHVDIADRNLVVNGTDATMRGPGQSLSVRRTYNSLAAAAGRSGPFGNGWVMNGGADMGITVSREQVTFTQAGGALAWFVRHFEQPDLNVKVNDKNSLGSSWSPGHEADLTKPTDTTYKLTYRASHLVYTFTLPKSDATTGYLSSVDDGRGNTVNYEASGTPLRTTKVTDATGQRSINFTYTNGRVTGMSESLAPGATGARSWSYSYDANGNLTQSTDPAGKRTLYCYTPTALLETIITARGAALGATCSAHASRPGVTSFSYDSGGPVASVVYRNLPDGDAAVNFDTGLPLPPGGSSGTTTLTDPYGEVTTYTYDPADKVTLTKSPMGYSASTTYNTNFDVTAAVDPNSFTGTGGDPSTTASYTGDNLTKVATPAGAGISDVHRLGGQPAQQRLRRLRPRQHDAGRVTSPATGLSYTGSGQIKASAREPRRWPYAARATPASRTAGPVRLRLLPTRARCARPRR